MDQLMEEQSMITFCHEDALLSLQREMEQATEAAEQKYDDLAQAYGELKEAWETRGPRDEDVAIINDLERGIQDRDQRLETVEERIHELGKVRFPVDAYVAVCEESKSRFLERSLDDCLVSLQASA